MEDDESLKTFTKIRQSERSNFEEQQQLQQVSL